MKHLIVILFVSLLVGTSCRPQKYLVSSNACPQVRYQWDYRNLVDRINGIYIPKDMDEAIDSLDVLFSAEEKLYIDDSLSLEDFCAVQHFDGWGIWMRNEWGLWSGSRLQQYFISKRIVHPDDMSGAILEGYYKRKIKGEDFSIEDYVVEEPEELSYATVTKLEKSEGFGSRFWFEGLAIGDTLYFQYPYGCSTPEEQDIWHEAEDCASLPKGKILEIKSQGRWVKIKLLETISPYGIIVFDGDIETDTEGELERDFKHFNVQAPNRFYMQKGDELWFDMHSDYWCTW